METVFSEFLESKGYCSSNYRIEAKVNHRTIKSYAKSIYDPIVRAEALELVERLYTV